MPPVPELYVAEQDASKAERARLSDGRALCEQGRWTQAQELFESLVAEGSVAALTELGLVRDELGDHAAALELFRRAVSRGDLAGHLALGTAALSDGDLAEAERLLTAGIEAGEEQWKWQLAEVHLARDDEAGAERLLRAAVLAGESRAWRDLALLLERRDDVPAAELAFRTGAAEGDATDRLELARFLVRQGRLAEAGQLLNDLSRAGVSAALLGFAELRREEEDFDAAAATYREAIAAGLLEAREDYADLLAYDLDEPDEAMAQWRLALDEDVVDRATLWWEIGQASERAGDLDHAQAAYENMLAEGDVDAHHALGELAQLRGDAEAAQRHFAAGAAAGDADAAAALRSLSAR